MAADAITGAPVPTAGPAEPTAAPEPAAAPDSAATDAADAAANPDQLHGDGRLVASGAGCGNLNVICDAFPRIPRLFPQTLSPAVPLRAPCSTLVAVRMES